MKLALILLFILMAGCSTKCECSRAQVVNKHYDNSSAGGFTTPNIKWGFIYELDNGASIKTQKSFVVGEIVSYLWCHQKGLGSWEKISWKKCGGEDE